MKAIEITGLKKAYSVGFLRKSERWGLKDLSLTVEEGEVFGCLGPNGAGKTTTLKLLMGLIYPTAGEARILGMDIQDPRVKAQIGFLPEQPYFYDHLTPRELLGYYGHLSGMSPAQIGTRVAEVLKRAGIEEPADTQLRKFSKGMLQRVGIAQAILHEPKIVFLDEPMSGLDPIGRREVRDLIESLRAEGKTIFFSTHILSDAETLCDRIAVLHKGELRGITSVSELASKTSGQSEIVVNGLRDTAAIEALSSDIRAAGGSIRIVVPTARVDAALEAIRRAQAQLVSVNPLRGSLEEYFLRHVDATPSVEKQP
jgi:ABC-2 type transport system ATP-binding protein